MWLWRCALWSCLLSYDPDHTGQSDRHANKLVKAHWRAEETEFRYCSHWGANAQISVPSREPMTT